MKYLKSRKNLSMYGFCIVKYVYSQNNEKSILSPKNNF